MIAPIEPQEIAGGPGPVGGQVYVIGFEERPGRIPSRPSPPLVQDSPRLESNGGTEGREPVQVHLKLMRQ